MPVPPVTAIAAMAVPTRVIGYRGHIPWDVPADRVFFRSYTDGKTLLLGRITFESMTGWFKGHRPIVLSHRPTYTHRDATAVVRSIADALALATAMNAPELVVCGGASIYASALPFTDTVLLTEIETTTTGDAYFPVLASDQWCRESSRQVLPPSPYTRFPLAFSTYRRIAPPLDPA